MKLWWPKGKKFEELFEILKRYDETVTSVTFWGLKDDYSWKSQTRNDWPLLLIKITNQNMPIGEL